MWQILKLSSAKILSGLAFCAVLTMSALQTLATETEGFENLTKWRMVWVDDFGALEGEFERQFSSEDIAPHLERYVRSVNIHTVTIDGQITSVRADARCNFMSLNKTSAQWGMTEKACWAGGKINGKETYFRWPLRMEKFLLKHAINSQHLRRDNILEWIDKTGEVVARFEIAPEKEP